jgi:hypothetical protein
MATKITRDESGGVQGTFMILGRPKRVRRGPQTAKSREDAMAVRRKGGPCERCKDLKLKVRNCESCTLLNGQANF